MGTGRFRWLDTSRSIARTLAINRLFAQLPSHQTRGAHIGASTEIVEALTVLFLVDDIPAELHAQRRSRDRLRIQLTRDIPKLEEHRPGTSLGAALLTEVEFLCQEATQPSLQTHGLAVARDGLMREARERATVASVIRPAPTKPKRKHSDSAPAISPTRKALRDHLRDLPQDAREHWRAVILRALQQNSSEVSPEVAVAVLNLLWPDLSAVGDKLRRLDASERATHVLECHVARKRAAAGVFPEEVRWREQLADELNWLAAQMIPPPAWDVASSDLRAGKALLRARLRRRASELI